MAKTPETQAKAPALTVSKVYQPDRERIARGLLALAGLSPNEIERALCRMRARQEVHDATAGPAS